MKKQLFLLVLLSTLALYNCRNNTSPEQKDNADGEFYPIGSFIRSQLMYIDSMPLAVIKYTTLDNITDTAILEKSDFKTIAAAFMTPDIGSPELMPQYKETSFIDATLGTVTLTYSAMHIDSGIKKADILLDQESTSVKNIYIEKILPGTDSSVTKKMLWTANRNCQITTLIRKKGQPEKIIRERYVWDDREPF